MRLGKRVNGLNEWINIETISGSVKNISRKVQKYQYTGDIFNQFPGDDHAKLDCILFQTVATIDREKAEKLDREWRENLGFCPLLSKNMEDIRNHQKTVQVTSV